MSKKYPRYNFDQTQAKIDHFHHSGTKPITCRRIAEQGFVCPLLEKCKAKSPAGLAFFALSTEELAKLLSKCKVKHDSVADIETARACVGDYLYNIDPGVAEVFINNKVRTHFGFKKEDIKSLPAYQKELYRQFSSQRTVKSDRNGEELPPWYEFTDRGALRFLPGELADYLAEKFHAFYCTEQYYFYRDGVYSPRTENDAEGQWQLKIRKPAREINPNPFIINCRNGLYNVMTNELSPHDSCILSTIQIHANYDLAAECPLFLQYLQGVLPESEVALVQEILGYMLIPVNKAQKSFLLVGAKDSEKSTLLFVAQDVLLGKENVSSLTWQASATARTRSTGA
jgi:putative DNA primase/helicase